MPNIEVTLPEGQDSITLATADTYVDKNITFTVTTSAGIEAISEEELAEILD